MTYRLWLGDLECGVAADQYAADWLHAIQQRYPHKNVRIEPAPGLAPTFPLGDDNSEEPDLTGAITTARCPHCQEVTAFPGFDRMLAFVCPHCGQGVQVVLPIA